MLPRWITEINNINLALHEMKRLSKHLIRKKKGRGRNPKHNPTNYAVLVALKEAEKHTLRRAECRLSLFVIGERVDHSVIGYWENKPEIQDCLKIIISRAGQLLDKMCKHEFTFVDATDFTSWNKDLVQVHVANRIVNGTIYPIGVSFKKNNVHGPVAECLPSGSGKVYADAGYDANKAIGVMFEKGYEPIVCPNKRRSKGYHRRKARKLYRMPENRLGYRQRGRGESLFGSQTNEFGDRFNARSKEAMRVRILSRIISYQIKLLIRCNGKTISIHVLIVRHAR
tara:strand:- start:24 stop:875 length:852 start_codon:yes stop_codon:yes gene_type:complete